MKPSNIDANLEIYATYPITVGREPIGDLPQH